MLERLKNNFSLIPKIYNCSDAQVAPGFVADPEVLEPCAVPNSGFLGYGQIRMLNNCENSRKLTF